ncbi:MAG: Helix-turn-helix protein [Rickettsiaceae bacterium]|jgi:transcriptional regulator with XRE-family HTH domain|nr:Helix-turn-helix protein [Rickettsiaceae bacterium]
MLSLITISKAQKKLAKNTRLQRLKLQLTQQGLAERAGVLLPTLRRFEQKGLISLEGFLKLQMVLGGLENLVKAIEPQQAVFSSIDEVLETNKTIRKRGSRK